MTMYLGPAIVRPVHISDYAQWTDLYRGYREFYRLTPDDAIVDRVWAWVNDPSHEVNGFVATFGPDVVGLAHFRRFARPSSGSTGIYLDDLFTSPDMRGRGVARSLLSELSTLAEAEGRTVVRWITAAHNHRARALYDSVATATPWVTYDLGPGSF